MNRTPIAIGSTIAVTGASGFVGSHICKCLLERGFQVRAIVRNKDDANKVDHLKALSKGLPSDRLTFFNGDLSLPGSYDEAFQGADAVVHTAAVVDVTNTANAEKLLVIPTVEGTRNVLESIDKSTSVKRLVHTSSIAAIYNVDQSDGTVFTEKDWNNYSTIANGDPYGYAKTKAEQLLCDHVKAEAHYDFVTINPGLVFGPCMTKAHTKASPFFVRQMLFGNEQPSFFVAPVDVRDVALAHVEALVRPEASRERFIMVEGPSRPLSELGPILQQQLPQYLLRPRFVPPYKMALMRAVSKFGWGLTPFQKQMLFKSFSFDNTKASSILGIQFRKVEEMVKDTALSIIEPGWIKVQLKAKA